MLVPKGKGIWKPFLESLDMFTEDFLAGKREQGSLEKRESLS
jgi:hypothetical protein